jgi:hypothetical protein
MLESPQHHPSEEAVASITDVKLEYAGNDIYGAVTGGRLLIGAQLARFKYQVSARETNITERKWGLDGKPENDDQLYWFLTWDTTDDDVVSELESLDLLVMPVISSKWSDQIEGLILKATGCGRGEFRRVGKIHVNARDGFINEFWDACKAFYAFETDLEYCLNSEGRRVYAISLV